MRTKKILPILLLPLALFSVPAAAETSVSYDLALNSAYVWRGITVTDGLVLQPAVAVSHDSGFGVSVWANGDIDDVNGQDGEFNEVDFTLSYGWGGDTTSFEVGWIEYMFPNGFGLSTSELYLSLGWDVVAAPSVAVYYDFDLVEDYYATVGVEFGSDLSDTWSWGLGLTAAFAGEDFASFYSGGTDSGLHDGLAQFTLSYAGEGYDFGVFAAYADNLDSDVLTDQKVDFFGGVTLSFSF